MTIEKEWRPPRRAASRISGGADRHTGDIARIAAFLLEYTTPRSVADETAALDSDVGVLGEHPHRAARRDEILPGPAGRFPVPDTGARVTRVLRA